MGLGQQIPVVSSSCFDLRLYSFFLRDT